MMNFLDDKLPDRFWSKVSPEPNSGCWLWTAAHVWNEYGVFRAEGKAIYAHRVSYVAENGLIPVGLQLDHLCRVRCCCNPAHLEPVTQRENMRRGVAGVIWGTETHCRYGHEYTVSNTAPRVDRANGRSCRECNRLKARKSRDGKQVAS